MSNFDTIKEALKKAKELERRNSRSEALVLGSLKLVEGILYIIERSEWYLNPYSTNQEESLKNSRSSTPHYILVGSKPK